MDQSRKDLSVPHSESRDPRRAQESIRNSMCPQEGRDNNRESVPMRLREYHVDGLARLDLPPSAPEQIPFLRTLVTFPAMAGLRFLKGEVSLSH